MSKLRGNELVCNEQINQPIHLALPLVWDSVVRDRIAVNMESRFENTYKVTKDEYKKWSGVNIWAYSFTYVWLILIALSFGFIVVPALCIVVETLCIYRAFFRLRFIQVMRYQNMAQRQGRNEWNRTIRFGDQITVVDGDTAATYDWGNHVTIWDAKGYSILIIRDGVEVVIKNDGFIMGNLEELKEFILRKIGQIDYETKQKRDIVGNMNNFKAIGIQIVIVVINWYLEWTASDEVLNIWGVFIYLIYFVAGFLLLNPNVKNAFLSVSSIFAISLIDAFIYYEVDFGSMLVEPMMGNPINWWLANSINCNSLYYFSACIPSMLLYLGILLKRYCQKRNHSC